MDSRHLSCINWKGLVLPLSNWTLMCDKHKPKMTNNCGAVILGNDSCPCFELSYVLCTHKFRLNKKKPTIFCTWARHSEYWWLCWTVCKIKNSRLWNYCHVFIEVGGKDLLPNVVRLKICLSWPSKFLTNVFTAIISKCRFRRHSHGWRIAKSA